jgi:hypothetical protein
MRLRQPTSNHQVIATGADICLASIKSRNPGANHCDAGPSTPHRDPIHRHLRTPPHHSHHRSHPYPTNRAQRTNTRGAAPDPGTTAERVEWPDKFSPHDAPKAATPAGTLSRRENVSGQRTTGRGRDKSCAARREPNNPRPRQLEQPKHPPGVAVQHRRMSTSPDDEWSGGD